jgi:hypothetical protein
VGFGGAVAPFGIFGAVGGGDFGLGWGEDAEVAVEEEELDAAVVGVVWRVVGGEGEVGAAAVGGELGVFGGGGAGGGHVLGDEGAAGVGAELGVDLEAAGGLEVAQGGVGEGFAGRGEDGVEHEVVLGAAPAGVGVHGVAVEVEPGVDVVAEEGDDGLGAVEGEGVVDVGVAGGVGVADDEDVGARALVVQPANGA